MEQGIADWLATWSHEESVAFQFEGRTTSYAEFAKRIRGTAHALKRAGIEPGDRVGFCGLNRVEVFELLFGCARIGAVFLPFNIRLTASELAVQISDAQPVLLLTTDGFDSLIDEAAAEVPRRDLDTQPFDASAAELDDPWPSPDAIALMIYTSGTTGQAKGAMLSHESIVYSALNAIDSQDLTDTDRVISAVPTFHVGGLNVQAIPALVAGAEIILQRRFDPELTLSLIEEQAVTQTVLVPAMLNAVAAHPAFDTTDLTSLVGIVSGSSLVPADCMQPFFDRGIPIGQTYGLTETGPTSIVLRYADAAAHIGSCGTAAKFTDVRLVDDSGTDVAQGDPGEVWLRGPNIFTAYYNNDAATDAAFVDGWFRTGDVGYEADDGFIYICDRIKDVVISGGENIYPAEIEPVLATHPALADVTVIGAADAKWGEVPVAVAILNHGMSLTIDELRQWCEGRMARFKQPRVLRIVDELPRTALGKVRKNELRDA